MFKSPSTYGMKLKTTGNRVKRHATQLAKLLPANMGSVIAFSFLSPLMSSMVFVISLPRFEEKESMKSITTIMDSVSPRS